MKVVDKFWAHRKFLRESLEQIKRHSETMSEEILQRYGKPDQIIYIERGGMIPGCLLSHMLEVKNVAAINASYYLGVNQRANDVTVGRVPELSVGSGYLLLVDDVADTGKTLRKVADAIKRKHNVEVVTCTVFYKPGSEVKPDIYAKEVSRDKWIIFGYEKEFDKRFKKNRRS